MQHPSNPRIINQQILAQITCPNTHQQLFQQFLPTVRQKYLISSKIQTLREVQSIAQKINKTHINKPIASLDPSKKGKMEAWAFRELKIFQTVCILYSLLHSVELQLFGQPELRYLGSIFLKKTDKFLRYELVALQKSKSKNNSEWRKNQIQLFISVVEQDQPSTTQSLQKLDWRYYSYQLFTLSKGRYYRTLQQCREKWTNYLNPQVSHALWSIQEDIKLFQLIKELGYRWSAISKHFEGQRTEHMVKNRFNSLIKSWCNKELKNLPSQQLSSKILTLLYAKASQTSNLGKKQITELTQQIALSKQQMSLCKLEKHQHNQAQSPKPQVPEAEPEPIQQNFLQEISLNINPPQQETQSPNFNIQTYNQDSLQAVIDEWNQHIDHKNNRYEKEEKDGKNTWDNQWELPTITQIQLLKHNPSNQQHFRGQSGDKKILKNACFQPYLSFFPLQKKDIYNSQLIELLGCGSLGQEIGKEDSWLEELQQKDMLSWLD